MKWSWSVLANKKKESLVGAVQAVKPEDLKMTSSNLSTSFAGNVPGIIAVQTQGEPGSDEAKILYTWYINFLVRIPHR